VINFDKLTRPTSTSAPLDPIEIFKRTPNLKDAPNDLWKGQAEALAKWHENRDASDNAIILNTGAGKSLVGILIAQSLVNEQIGPIVLACSTIDLVYQTSRECDRIGIKYSTRVQKEFSNDLFETGRAFCITTYQALFAPISAFKRQNDPRCIIFDDAHVAERLIRDSFTLSIPKHKFPNLFDKITQIVRPEFEALSKEAHLKYILAEVGQQTVTLCPPCTSRRRREQIIQALKDEDYKNNSLFFPTVQLFEHIHHCAIFLSATHIEITPPFIPTGIFPFLGEERRRIYLSATLEYETDFVRGFGRKIPNPIVPDNDAGNGERLILLASDFDEKSTKLLVAKSILTKQKLLISAPSYNQAKTWQEIAVPPEQAKFSQELNDFRQARSGAFILVSRIDGIDLPQDTCRVMIIDGAPSGSSLMEKYLLSQLQMSNLFSTKLAGRITQLLGRINRGRSDYGAFVFYGKDINIWVKREANIALLPSLIRKQIILGQSLQKDIGKSKSNEVASLVNQVIARDEGWLTFYRDTVDGLEVSSEALDKVRKREAALSVSAVAECSFMTKLWQEDIEGARKVLLDVLDGTAVADARLAGWYSLWLGMTYEAQNDYETAIAHYKRARSRLSHWLNIPFRSDEDLKAIKGEPKTKLQELLLTTNQHGPQSLGNLITKLYSQAKVLKDQGASSNQHEEALRMFGELIGFSASRPDNELGAGPDVIWVDEDTKYIVAFEMKTKKDAPAKYKKEEIGQVHNHQQWLKDEYSQYKSDGALIVGPPGACNRDASPTEDIFLVETATIAHRMEELAAKVEDTRGRIVIERWTALNALGGLSEWQLTGWFRVLAQTPIKSLKA
jgi:tetratricopeptide (TPR) repeat protein